LAAGAEADPISAPLTFPEMPFPGPETALASTIDGEHRENLIRKFIARPAAS
jgi:hypothetical protein